MTPRKTFTLKYNNFKVRKLTTVFENILRHFARLIFLTKFSDYSFTNSFGSPGHYSHFSSISQIRFLCVRCHNLSCYSRKAAEMYYLQRLCFLFGSFTASENQSALTVKAKPETKVDCNLKDLGREWGFSHRVFWDIPSQCVTADCLFRSFQNFSFFWSSSMAIFNRIISSLLLLIYFSSSAYGFIEGLYCGTENCYDGNVVHLSFLFFRNKKLCHRVPYQLYYLVHADQG